MTRVELRTVGRHSARAAAVFAATLFIAMVSVTPECRGDIVHLTNGNTIQGEVILENEHEIIVRFPGGKLNLPRRRVERVERQSTLRYLLDEGEKQLRRGSYADAVKTFQEALQHRPESIEARKGIIRAGTKRAGELRALGRYRESRATFTWLAELEGAPAALREEIAGIDAILAEATRELRQAEVELAAGDINSALIRFRRLFESFPDRRREIAPSFAAALIQKADRLRQKRDWRRAAKLYLESIGVSPPIFPQAKPAYVTTVVQILQPLAREGDFAALEEEVATALSVAPTNPTLRYFRGLSLEGQGHRRRAAEEYLDILGTPRPARLEEAASELRRSVEARLQETDLELPAPQPGSPNVEGSGFKKLTTRRFEIQHRSLSLAREIAHVAEKKYQQLFQLLGCATHLRSRIRIFLHPDKEHYLRASGMSAWSDGSHRVARKLGALSEHHIHCYQRQPRLLTVILPHELAHALFSLRLNYPDSVPLWANEGFANYIVPHYHNRYFRTIVAQELRRKNLIPFETLLNRSVYPEKRVGLFYGQSLSLVRFLINTRGITKFVKFVRGLSTGRVSVADALRTHYDIQSVMALENHWQEWFRHSVQGSQARGG